jgi:hypothetical protein
MTTVALGLCGATLVWALYELLVWLPRKRRELKAIEREWQRMRDGL